MSSITPTFHRGPSSLAGFAPLVLDQPASVERLLRLALVHRASGTTAFLDLSQTEQHTVMGSLLRTLGNATRRAMLRTYFGIDITDDLCLRALPQVRACCRGSCFANSRRSSRTSSRTGRGFLASSFGSHPRLSHAPTTAPSLLTLVACKVSYGVEQEAMRQLAAELADFMAPVACASSLPIVLHSTGAQVHLANEAALTEQELGERNYMTQYVLFEAMKCCDFKPPKHLAQGKSCTPDRFARSISPRQTLSRTSYRWTRSTRLVRVHPPLLRSCSIQPKRSSSGARD